MPSFRISQAPDDAVMEMIAATCGYTKGQIEEIWWSSREGNRMSEMLWHKLLGETERNA